MAGLGTRKERGECGIHHTRPECACGGFARGDATDAADETAHGAAPFRGCLRALLDASCPPTAHRERLRRCLQDLRAAVQASLPVDERWSAAAFGSAVNGFGTSCSDLDVTVYSERCSEGQEKRAVAVLRRLEKWLLSHHPESFTVRYAVFRARIPVLKLCYQERLEVDLSAINSVPLRNTRLLRAYADLDRRVMELGIAVKLWAKGQGLCGASAACLSSYAFLLMAVYYLQVAIPDGVPSLQGMCTDDRAFDDDGSVTSLRRAVSSSGWRLSEGVEALSRGFFGFYATEFGWGSEVVSVRLGSRRDASCADFEALSGRAERQLHIEDPFERSRNLCDVLAWRNEEALRHALRRADAAVRAGHHARAFAQMECGEAVQLGVGSTAVARRAVAAPGEGYLGVEAGERVEAARARVSAQFT